MIVRRMRTLALFVKEILHHVERVSRYQYLFFCETKAHVRWGRNNTCVTNSLSAFVVLMVCLLALRAVS